MNARHSEAGQRRFLFVVTNHRRDLEGHALVGWHLVRRYGHEARFCNVPSLQRAMLREAPDVVVLDRVDTRVHLARLARSLGMKIALLPTVGFTQDTTEIEARRAGKHVSGEDLLDCCFTWGEYGRRMVLEQTRLPASRVHAVGSPRFDAYSAPYLSLAESRETLVRRSGLADPSAPLVVWATNTYHTRSRDIERTVANAVATGVPEAEIRGQLADEGTAFRDLAGATLHLAAAHPDWNFLVKLHPSEAETPYREIAARCPNIGIAPSDARIRDVLHRCDALMANTSTTATEAWMLGKPVFEVAFGGYRIPTPSGYVDGSYLVTNLEALERLLVKHIEPPATPLPEEQRRARTELIERVYLRIDGRASERCAAVLHDLVAAPGYPDATQRAIRALAAEEYARWQRAMTRCLPYRVKRALGMSDEVTLRFWSSSFWRQWREPREVAAWDEEITPDMVRTLFDGFDHAHGIDAEMTEDARHHPHAAAQRA